MNDMVSIRKMRSFADLPAEREAGKAAGVGGLLDSDPEDFFRGGKPIV
jgi:hypothetical protein